ncbi:MAG: tetratricopeptide repeat protein [Chloroflexota bacterium]
MTHSQSTPTPLLTIHFATTTTTAPHNEPVYSVHLNSPAVGDARGEMTVPFNTTTWRAVQFALEPNFDPQDPPKELHPHLEPLGDLTRLKPTIGDILGEALLASPDVRSLFDRALALAAADRQTLPVELRFGEGCDELAALPWELIRYEHGFLVGDTSIALSRYPEGLIPPTPTLANLPLRVLLVLSEPLDASPIFPARAKEELLHGLRSLDEEGAVIVDELKPPTFDTLVEAVRNGQYHMLIFYGHGGHGDKGGILLFEDEFGRGDRVPAAEVGAAMRNTEVRLVLLGACKSATVNPLPSLPSGRSAREREQFGDGEGEGQIWQGTAAALVKAGVPLSLGMQVSMRVDAAQAFLRQFALSLAAGKEITEAVADARLPILRSTYGESWFIPALYGRPKDGQRFFDASKPLPTENAELRTTMKEARSQIEQLERTIGSVGVMGQGSEIAELRSARQRFADARFELARNTDGGYHQVTSPLYGVPSQKLFVGRSDEMMQVGQALKQNNPVVIWGVGGLGKSALATEVVYRQSWRFPGGVLWLDCQNGPPFESLLERIAAFCGLADLNQTPPDEKEGVVRALLARLEERCLLIWDNAEDVWTDSRIRRFIQDQLPANAQSMLTTRVDPDRTNWPTIEIRPLADPIMNDLFVALATAKGVKVGSQNDLDVIDPMLTWLEGHPLALELLIPLAHKRGLTRVWAELQKKPLKGIEAAFDISYQGLTSDQQRLFARLSVFMITFEYNAAAALLPEHDNTDEDLDTLVQRALIHFDGSRYSYHALVRQFAYQRLKDQEEKVATVHQAAAQYLLNEAAVRARTPDEFLEEVDQWAKAKQWASLVRSSSDLVSELSPSGYWSEIEQRLEIAQDHSHKITENREVLARLDAARGTIAYKQSRWVDATDFYKIARQQFEQIGEYNRLAQIDTSLGEVYRIRGEWDKAFNCFENSLRILDQTEDHSSKGGLFNNIGELYRMQGKWDLAVEYYNKSLTSFQNIDNSRGISYVLNNLGLVYQKLGNWSLATDSYLKSQRVLEEINDLAGMASGHNNLGIVYQAMGDSEIAASYYEHSLQYYERIGDAHGMGKVYNNLGELYRNKGEWDTAINYYQKDLEICLDLRDESGAATTYNNLGIAYQAKEIWGTATELYLKSIEVNERIGDTHAIAGTYNNLGILYQLNEEWNTAIDFYQRSIRLYEELGEALVVANAYNNLGAVHQAKEELDTALEYFRKALKVYELSGNILGTANSFANLGMYHFMQNDLEMAKSYLARAYLIFDGQEAIPQLQQTGGWLVRILGSPEAVDRYLQQMLSQL